MYLGEIVKEYRERNGNMTMDDFADKSGLSKSYISMLEKVHNYKTGEPIVPSITTYNKCAKAMRMSLDTLFEMVGDDGLVDISEKGEDILAADPETDRIVKRMLQDKGVISLLDGVGDLSEEEIINGIKFLLLLRKHQKE